jgi:uncharacterized membrane protein YfcA
VLAPIMLAFVAAAFLLAGFVKGVVGLGLPTVAIGLLGLLMTPAQAAAIIVVPSLVTNAWQCVAGGAMLDLLRRLWPLLAGVCAGTLVAALWLPPGATGATTWLGIALAFYAALGLVNVRFSVAPASETGIGLLVGGLTGVISVATGVLAVPSAPYIQALELGRDRLVQALGLSFTVSTVALALALAHAGEMSADLVLPSAVALVSAMVGMLLGQIVRGKVKTETFRLIFLLGLLLLGGHLALHALI